MRVNHYENAARKSLNSTKKEVTAPTDQQQEIFA
jgi:hypothetical protein